MENKNRFSILLEYLIGTAGLKNYILAQELQYDVSYISKWVTGKVIPAERTEKRCWTESATASFMPGQRRVLHSCVTITRLTSSRT